MNSLVTLYLLYYYIAPAPAIRVGCRSILQVESGNETSYIAMCSSLVEPLPSLVGSDDEIHLL